jgi:[acyl-carrier-protein] S-malonyltransferase
VRDCLVRQVTGTVRWVECVHLLVAQGATHLFEVGPGKVLTGLNRQILGKDSTIPAVHIDDLHALEKALETLNHPQPVS